MSLPGDCDKRLIIKIIFWINPVLKFIMASIFALVKISYCLYNKIFALRGQDLCIGSKYVQWCMLFDMLGIWVAPLSINSGE